MDSITLASVLLAILAILILVVVAMYTRSGRRGAEKFGASAMESSMHSG
jgi:hypothetical protein